MEELNTLACLYTFTCIIIKIFSLATILTVSECKLLAGLLKWTDRVERPGNIKSNIIKSKYHCCNHHTMMYHFNYHVCLYARA